MEVAYLYLRFLLAAVFSIAAAGKLLDLKGSRNAAIDFGAPSFIAGPISIALPVIEISIAALLLEQSTVFVGALSSAALLSLFTILMLIQKLKGNSPDCHCFGAVGSEPIGTLSIIRNIVLIAIASAVAFPIGGRDGGSLFDYDLVLLLPIIASAILPVILLISVSNANDLKRKVSDLSARIEDLESPHLNGAESSLLGHPEDGLPVGAPIPNFEAVSLESSERVALSDRVANGNHIMVFVGPECAPCGAMLPDLVEMKREFEGRISVTVISDGDAERNREKFSSLGMENIFLQEEKKKISSLFLAKWTPVAILLSNGKISSRVAAGELNIRKLFEEQRGKDFSSTLHTSFGIPRSRYRIGEQVPEFSLFSLSGEMLRGDDFKGSGGIIIFTDASCSHCDKVADSVIEIQRNGSDSVTKDFRFLFLNSGSAEKLIAKGLADSTAIDEGHMLGRMMGAFGAPSAILINAEGRISSETAVGYVAINALLGIHGGNLDR